MSLPFLFILKFSTDFEPLLLLPMKSEGAVIEITVLITKNKSASKFLSRHFILYLYQHLYC